MYIPIVKLIPGNRRRALHLHVVLYILHRVASEIIGVERSTTCVDYSLSKGWR